MEAALNGVPSFRVLDGWWIEGCIEGVTGWAIGANHRGLETHDDRSQDAAALYDKLEQGILPMFYTDRDSFINVMCHAMALNGSFFNTQRMMQQYVVKAYFLNSSLCSLYVVTATIRKKRGTKMPGHAE